MVFGTGCKPGVDWSLCEEESGYTRILPVVFIMSAALYGATAILYADSMVRILRTQLREKKRMSYNTVVQMHTGVVVFSFAAFIHGVCLATPEPGLPALPLLLLLHLKHIGVGYVTTVLVRHWAVLYQQMGRSQQGGQLNERVSRFVELYRDGEVIQAVTTCSFFFGFVVYGVNNQENWDQVERFLYLVWTIISATTCWLIAVVGQRVYVNMKRVATSRAVLDYLRRVKYTVIGSSLLWCYRSLCFGLKAYFGSPLSASMWLFCHSGIVLTGVAAASLYYVVIGSKIAVKAAKSVEAASPPVEGVAQVQRKFRALAVLVSSGANQFMEGVSTITSIGETSARVHMNENSDEPAMSYRRIGRRWSASRRGVDTGALAGQNVSVRASGSGPAPGSGVGEPRKPRVAKSPMPNRSDEEVGGVNEQGRGEEKSQGEAQWKSSVLPMTSQTPFRRSLTSDTTTEADATSGEEDTRDKQHLRDRAPRKRSSWSRAHHLSSDDSATSSGDSSRDEEESWKIEELNDHSLRSSSHDDSGDSRQHSRTTDATTP